MEHQKQLRINEEDNLLLDNDSKNTLKAKDELEKQLKSVKSNKKLIEEELSGSKNNYDNAKKEINNLKLELNSLKEKVNDKDVINNDLNIRLKNLITELEKIKTVETNLIKKTDEMHKNAISLSDSKLISLAKENTKCVTDCNKFQKDIKTLQNEIRNYENVVIEKDKTIDELKKIQFDVN